MHESNGAKTFQTVASTCVLLLHSFTFICDKMSSFLIFKTVSQGFLTENKIEKHCSTICLL